MPVEKARATPRAAARFRVDYACEGNYLISYSRNISADGMFVCTKTPAPVGALLQLVFSIGDLHEVAVTAQVVWSGPLRGAGECGMGLRFIDAPPTLRDAVLEIVHRVAVLAEPEAPRGRGRLPN